MYGEGISKTGDLLDCGVASDFVEKSGSWYSYAGERIGQGRENAKAYLVEHPDIADQIEAKVMEKLRLDREEATSSAASESILGADLADEIVRIDEDGVVIESD